MNSGQPPQKDSGEPFCWIWRPTLQLKIKANSSTENEGQLLEWIQANPPRGFRWTLLLNFKANSSAENEGQLFSWKLRPTLQLKIKVNSSTEN